MHGADAYQCVQEFQVLQKIEPLNNDLKTRIRQTILCRAECFDITDVLHR